VPGGIEHGLRLQLSGQGEVGFGGGPSGDIYVEVSVRSHETFEREGDDLTCVLNVPLVDAVLGAQATIATFDGPEQIEIKPGQQSGDVLTIKGKGVKHLRHNGRGDLLVTIQVQTPTKLDGKERDAFRKFADLRGSDKSTLASRNSSSFSKGRRR
jgi:molecular chaperone DnaJ